MSPRVIVIASVESPGKSWKVCVSKGGVYLLIPGSQYQAGMSDMMAGPRAVASVSGERLNKLDEVGRKALRAFEKLVTVHKVMEK